MIIERDIYQLSVGAYVVDIVQQRGHYKIKHSGWVKDFHAIEHLIEQGVLRVRVDTSKRRKPEENKDVKNVLDADAEAEKVEQPLDLTSQSGQNEKPDESADKGQVADKPGVLAQNYAERLSVAKTLFDDAKKIQSKVLDDIKNGQPVDPAPIKALTDQSIEQIFENPDALACVINIRRKDEYLLEHSISVSILMTIFCRFLKFERELTHALAVGAFLHDVGKIKIPDKVLNKPGKLTASEFEVIKKHAVFSKKIVDETSDLAAVTRQVVANHHEKLNGGGYPLGLGAEDLSTYDRMITICDIYDALCAHRVYKQGIAQIKAFVILRELAKNGELDPVKVDQFIRCLGVYPVGSLVKLNTNRLAIVKSRNQENPTQPVVKAFFNLKQNVFTFAKDIDLSSDVEESIEKGVRADDFDLDMNKITEFLLMQG